ncbi:MAG: carbamoyltransferase HypF, partial [Planctomycetota bacterium]
LAATRLASGRGTTPCSSLGRLFDAIAALLGVASSNRHEGDAAIRLETLAHTAAPAPLALPLRCDGPIALLDTPQLTRDLLDHLDAGAAPAALARGFHDAVADAFVAAAVRAAAEHAVDTVALTGGCLLNRLLRRRMQAGLEQDGLRVLTHRRTPPGDGCLALGQALIAAERVID